MNAIRKTKHRCKVCNDYIKVYRHNHKYNYCRCERCNIVYVIERKTDKWVRYYEPRKVMRMDYMDMAVNDYECEFETI